MLLRVSVPVLVIYGGMLVATWWGFVSTPKGFVPQQDMGYMIVNVQLPDASSIERTHEATSADAEDLQGYAGGRAHAVGLRHVVFEPGNVVDLRFDVRHSGRF